MTDLLAALRAVEETAEKAKERAQRYAGEREVKADGSPGRMMGLTERELARDVLALTDLPFRAVREELERLAWIEEAARVLVACEACRRRLLGWGTNEHLRALDAVLCPDPAECVCGEINARHCPVHNELDPAGGEG